MKDADFIDYSMQMHSMSPDQKLLFLKELVDSMQKNYKKPGFIVTSQEELEQKLEESFQSLEKEKQEDELINTWKDKNLDHYDSSTQVEILKIRLKLQERLLKLSKIGLKDSDLFCKPIQEKINRLPKYEDERKFIYFSPGSS